MYMPVPVCLPSASSPAGSRRRVARRAAPPRRCDTGVTLRFVPTHRRRHAITETPPVQAALDELRHELGTDRIELGELVVLGARTKLQDLRARRDQQTERRARLATRVRARRVGADLGLAQTVRASGWVRP